MADIREWFFVSFVAICSVNCAEVCRKINSCKCKMEDSGKIINLRSLAHPGNLPKWTLSGGDGWMYKYNPCLGYALGTYEDLAVGQAATSGAAYDLGVQTSAEFNVSDEGNIVIKYMAKDELRSTTVILKCDKSSMYERLDFMGEVKITQYEMILTSACACPGYCNDLGLYDEFARNITGYRDDQYHSVHDAPKRSFPEKIINFSEITSASLILVVHDLALVLILVSCVIIIRYCWSRRKEKRQSTACRHCDNSSALTPPRYTAAPARQMQCNNDMQTYKVMSENNDLCTVPSHHRFLTSSS